jgi:hypothetical protein
LFEEAKMLELKSEFLCELVGDLDDPQVIGQTPRGIRMIFPVIGGTVKGPKLNGETLSGGADWAVIRSDGVIELDVRISMRADDDHLIYGYYRGILKVDPQVHARIQSGEEVDPSEYYFRSTPTFETGSEKYSWLNQIVCVGVGQLAPKRVRYSVYQIL